MDSYASTEALSKRLGNAVYTEIYPDEEEAAADLSAAAAEIDGSIAKRYRLPVTGERSLALLKDWNLTLAEERAYAHPAGGDFTEKVKTRVAQVRQYLEQIRNDTFRLPDAAENRNGSAAFASVAPPVFGRENTKEL